MQVKVKGAEYDRAKFEEIKRAQLYRNGNQISIVENNGSFTIARIQEI